VTKVKVTLQNNHHTIEWFRCMRDIIFSTWAGLARARAQSGD